MNIQSVLCNTELGVPIEEIAREMAYRAIYEYCLRHMEDSSTKVTQDELSIVRSLLLTMSPTKVPSDYDPYEEPVGTVIVFVAHPIATTTRN